MAGRGSHPGGLPTREGSHPTAPFWGVFAPMGWQGSPQPSLQGHLPPQPAVADEIDEGHHHGHQQQSSADDGAQDDTIAGGHCGDTSTLSAPPAGVGKLRQGGDRQRCTFLEDVECDLGGLAHDVGGVLDVTGEGTVVGVVQVVDDDGAVLAAGVAHPLHPLLEAAHVIDVGLTLGIVEYLAMGTDTRTSGSRWLWPQQGHPTPRSGAGAYGDAVTGTLSLEVPGDGDVLGDPLAGPEAAGEGDVGADGAVHLPLRVHVDG